MRIRHTKFLSQTLLRSFVNLLIEMIRMSKLFKQKKKPEEKKPEEKKK